MALTRTLAFTLILALLWGCNTNQPKPEAEALQKAEAVPAATPVAAEVPVRESKPVCKEEAATGKSGSGKKAAVKNKSAADAKCIPAAAAMPGKSREIPNAAQSTTSGSYDLSKNKPVTDSTKVESGQGTLVKGINDWQGEITGLPAANSRFTKLKIGMPQKQVTDLIGEPTDQGAYVTGKAFIPFYFGSDKTRWEMVYKGQGRLIFSNQSGFGTGYYLTWVIHNANEPGYR